MVDIGSVLAKIRTLGADVQISNGILTISNGAALTNEQRLWIAQNRAMIEDHLAPVMRGELPPASADDTPALTWGQMARILYATPPEGMDPYDWSYFVTQGGKIVRSFFGEVE